MSISIPQLPKGTRDFYPEAERIQNYIFDTWRKSPNLLPTKNTKARCLSIWSFTRASPAKKS